MNKCKDTSPVNITLGVIGGKWKPLIMWHLQSGPVRFGELYRKIPGVTQKMLTQQLRELEHDQLIDRKVFPEVPPKVEYSISEYGQSLSPVLKSMADWGLNYLQYRKDQPL